jgi:hypothetical protein
MADYTLIQSGDPDAAENVGVLVGSPQLGSRLIEGMVFTVDYGVPDFDLAAGKTAHVLDTATAEWTDDQGNQQSETRHEVLLICHLDARTGIALTDGDVNHIFIEPNWNTDDSPSVVTNTTGSKPTPESVKIGEIDTSNNVKSEQWHLVGADGTLTFPDEAAADSAAANIREGTVLYERANDTYYYVT